MAQKILNILFIGDIVGKPGFDLTATLLKNYIQKYEVDFCIANGETLVEGKGINKTDETSVEIHLRLCYLTAYEGTAPETTGR